VNDRAITSQTQGCGTITVGDEQREVKAGGIVVIPADTPHRFVNSGDTTLHQIDITPVRNLSRRISREDFDRIVSFHSSEARVDICRKISQNFSPAGVTSPFEARAMPTDAVSIVPLSGRR